MVADGLIILNSLKPDDVLCSNWNCVGTGPGNNRGTCTEPSCRVVGWASTILFLLQPLPNCIFRMCYIYMYIIINLRMYPK